MDEVIKKIHEFEKEINSNHFVVKEKFECINQPAENSMTTVQRNLKRIESSVLDFYDVSNGIEISWKASDPEMLKREMLGKVKVNSFSQLIVDWSGIVFFDNEPMDSEIRKFYPLDFFADEAAVGFCTKEGWRSMLYLYQFDGKLIPLQVNFKSYIELMLLAKACFYWQYLIIELLGKKENVVSERIKKYLPMIFSDFSFSAFEKLFKKLKLN